MDRTQRKLQHQKEPQVRITRQPPAQLHAGEEQWVLMPDNTLRHYKQVAGRLWWRDYQPSTNQTGITAHMQDTTLHSGGADGPLHNLEAERDPTPNDDTGEGYEYTSLWVNTGADRVFDCLDPTLGAAVWRQRIKHEVSATRAPALTDDWTQGFAVGSMWIYNRRVWQCMDPAVDNADWLELTPGQLPVYTEDPADKPPGAIWMIDSSEGG